MPELFKWSDSWLLGLPTLDDEHRALAILINQFASAMTAGDRQGSLLLLERLCSHARSHFQHEEQMMERIGYPGLIKHRHEHVMLLGELNALKARLANNPAPLHPRTLPALKEWLVAHIVGSDRDFAAAYLANQRVIGKGDHATL